MAITKWDGAWTSRGTVLTTELDALGSAARSNAGSELANQTNLDQYAKAEIQVDFASAPAAGALFHLYMVTAPDGTNYDDGSASVGPGGHRLVAIIPVRADAAAQRLMSQIFELEPAKTKFLLVNSTSQALPANGTTVTIYTQNDETV